MRGQLYMYYFFYLCDMFLRFSFRNNPKTGNTETYYRLVEISRNFNDVVCHKLILNIGFTNNEINIDQLIKVVSILNERVNGKGNLLEEKDQIVINYVNKLWQELLDSKKIDLSEAGIEKKRRSVGLNTLTQDNVRKVGGEWLSYQCLKQLELDVFLKELGLNEETIQLSLTQIISRSVSPNSELETFSWIKEDSAVCEITQYPIEKITINELYKNAKLLYKHKDRIEQFLGKRTNELFDLTDKIILYDLTNTYFECRKIASELSKFGRYKSIHNDDKLIVLAMAINVEGFIKYTDIFKGKKSNSNSLPLILNKLRDRTSGLTSKAIVVIDAGIATEENLSIIKSKGYDYVCVGQDKVKLSALPKKSDKKIIFTQNNQTLYLQRIQIDNVENYSLEVTSSANKIKEESVATELVGKYILKTTLPIEEEKVIWNIYNTIQEIESNFKTLKNDLDLRPINNQYDDDTLVHLHVGLLSYWVVNAIRYQLKKHNIQDSWKEILRKTNTQSMITTSGINAFNELVIVINCSIPNVDLKIIYDALNYKYCPLRKIKYEENKP